MTSHGDCLTKQDWSDEVEDEGNWLPNDQCRVGQKNGDRTHYGQAKEKLEVLTRLVLIMTEYKGLLQDVVTNIQEADDELRLVLKSIKTDLEKTSNELEPPEKEKTRNEMENRIITNLTELAEGQEAIKSTLNHYITTEDLTRHFEMILIQRDQDREKATRPPVRCYWCHKEGHFKRECPQR